MILKLPVVEVGVVVVPPEPPVAEAPDDPDGVGELPPPPQPRNSANASRSNGFVTRLESLRPDLGTASNRNPKIGDKVASEALRGRAGEDEDAAFAVKVTTANPPANILAGSKLQVTFAGSPLQESVMPAWNAGLGYV